MGLSFAQCKEKQAAQVDISVIASCEDGEELPRMSDIRHDTGGTDLKLNIE